MSKCYVITKKWDFGKIRELELIKRTAKMVVVKGYYFNDDSETKMHIDTENELIAFNKEEARKAAHDIIKTKMSGHKKQIQFLKSVEIKFN